MWSWRDWRRRKTLARHALAPELWAGVRQALSMLDGLDSAQDQRLQALCILFLLDKRLTALPGVDLDDHGRLLLAAQAQLPLLELPEADWYRGFHEIVLYPDDFLSPQRHRDASGVEHVWDDERSGEAWQQGPIILAWPGVQASGGWEGYNLVIHEIAHKLDMLTGDANGLPPCTATCACKPGPAPCEAPLMTSIANSTPIPMQKPPLIPMRLKTLASSLRSPVSISSARRICSTKPTRRSTNS